MTISDRIKSVTSRCPSLLHLGSPTAFAVDPRVFSDINLDKLLDSHTLEVMATPLGREDIDARNRVFASLESESGYAEMTRLFLSLTELTQALASHKAAQTELERLFLFVRLAEKFAEVYSMPTFDIDSPLVKRLNDYLASNEVRETVALLTKRLTDVRAILAEVSVFNAEFKSGMRNSALREDEPSDDICERIRGYADTLGIAKRPTVALSRERLTSELADSLAEFFAPQVRLLAELADEWAELTSERLHELRAHADFYITVADLICRADKAGFPHCFATVASEPTCRMTNAADISLLLKKVEPITNDVAFDTSERIFFLTGANGGGKTTFLRSVAINLLLFMSGAPIIAESATISPFGGVFTHFPSDERFTTSGRLVDEKNRVDKIIDSAVGNAPSFVMLNETFSGTDDKKGYSLALDTVKRIDDSGCFLLYVTHFHEVADTDYPLLTTEIDEADENRRTFKIKRVRGKRSSFAEDILRKYSLDAESLRLRAIEKKGGAQK